MLKIAVFLGLFAVGSFGRVLRNDDYVPTEQDIHDGISLTFCACDQGNHDGDLTLDEWMHPICEVNF